MDRERATILFHHGIGASAGIWAGWLPSLVDPIAWSASTCAAAAVRNSGGGFRLVARPLVEDLFAVADAAGLKRFHLVGESIGGTVALAAALARPERIATLPSATAPISAPRSSASRRGGASSTKVA